MNGGKGIYVGGTLISILISLALYFSGKRETAIFVGLWRRPSSTWVRAF
jgi:TfoX/Sxy family transcriptional regulator of competence genes